MFKDLTVSLKCLRLNHVNKEINKETDLISDNSFDEYLTKKANARLVRAYKQKEDLEQELGINANMFA